MKITSAKYTTSVVREEDLIQDKRFQFAFVGRSNVGKSSFINKLVNQKRLAKTSSTPGLTKMVNYFLINDDFYFVDLPGYGFAKTDNKSKQIWSQVIEKYLYPNEKLLTVFVLLDIRLLPSEQDKRMIEFLLYYQIPFKIITTKIDKVSKSQMTNSISKIANYLNIRKESISPVSSESGYGISDILGFIEGKLQVSGENND